MKDSNIEILDDSSMAWNLNVFQRLINQSVSLDIPLADEVLVLLLLGVHPNSWDTLMMTLGNSILEGKLTLDMLNSSLLNKEARQKEHDSNVL